MPSEAPSVAATTALALGEPLPLYGSASAGIARLLRGHGGWRRRSRRDSASSVLRTGGSGAADLVALAVTAWFVKSKLS